MVESKISGGFWGERQQLIAQETLYRQYEILDGRRDGLLEEQYSHVIENFMIAAGHKKGPYKGYVYSDIELGKWIEAAAYSLLNYPDKKLEEKVDRLVDLIERVQMEDGYVNTWFQVVHPEKRLQHFAFSCELYNMGHLMEAAVAYYEVTGKRKFLDIMCKTGDLLCDLMKQEKYCHVYDGHAEIELGLFRLYEVTGKREYLELSLHFIKERGQQPCFFQQEELLGDNDEGANDKWFGADHHQAHMPVSQQKTAEGHAVKLVYLYTAVADMIGAGMDSGCRLEKAMLQVWDNMVSRRMYVTGAIGSHAYAERFSVDYDLPGDRGYLETCASIGLCFWAKRLLGLYHNAVYADYLELTLYNGVLAGWSLDGNSYFYTNTLHYRKGITDYRQDCGHLEKERQGWFKCACCPSNILRLVASVQKYCIETDEDRIYVNLYAEGYWRMRVGEGVLYLEMETQYPYAGEIKIKVIPQNEPLKTEIALRLPSWCRKYKLMEKGCSVAEKEVHQEKGYLVLKRQWEGKQNLLSR